MKKAIIIIFWWLCSVVVSATNYYIKNGGDDALSGKSDAEAWETLAKANKSSFSPGDTIFLKRGDEWYECLNPISSGASGKPVVYSAYGTGAKPIISFAIQYTGWKKLKNNIYFVTGVYKTISLCLFDGTDWGLRVSTVADLDMHHEYTEVVTFPLGTPDDTLFIYTDVPADTSNIIFAKEAAPVYINGKNYITLEKLNIKYAGAHCLNITGSSYINIDSCKIEWGAAQGIQLSATIQSNVSNNIIQNNGNDGIFVTGYSNFNNIHHNLIRNNSLKGGTGGDRQAIGIWFCRDVNVYNNDIIHDGVGSVIEASSTSYYQDRIKFYNNKIIASIGDQTVFSFSAGDYDIYNNVVVITSGHDFSHFIATTGSSITSKFRAYHNTVIGAGTPVLRAATGEILTKESYSTLKNNIFYGASSRYYDIAPGFLPYVVSDNNIFLDDVGTKFWIGPHYNLSGWRSATGEDANSFIADPLFINNAIRDYSLSENSPAINKGAAVGILSDFNGNLRDENPDIGAFEFKTVITPVYLSSSIANATPSVIEMNFNLNLANIVPDVSAFDVRVNSVSGSVSSVAISGTKVLLTLSDPVVYGDAITIAYSKPANNPLQSVPGAQVTSFTDKIVTNNCTPPTNQSPLISISSPGKSSSFTAPATIIIDASASDPDGTIIKIEFYNGTVKLGEVTSTPYSFTWKDVNAGTYFITAAATDNLNAKTVSEGVQVQVNNLTSSINQHPLVSISFPQNNTKIIVPSTIIISADASDNDGTISKVEYYIENVKIGESSKAPYTISFDCNKTGTYMIYAIATDNLNAVTSSSSVKFYATSINHDSDFINLFPNPTIDGKFTVNLSSGNLVDAYHISIIDLHGKTISKDIILKDEVTKEYDLSGSDPGFYIMMISSNKIAFTKSFIIQ